MAKVKNIHACPCGLIIDGKYFTASDLLEKLKQAEEGIHTISKWIALEYKPKKYHEYMKDTNKILELSKRTITIN